MHSRTYLCPKCGEIKTGASSWYAPKCPKCGTEMKQLTYEQTYATQKLSPQKRVRWWESGAKVRRNQSKGKKKWMPVIERR